MTDSLSSDRLARLRKMATTRESFVIDQPTLLALVKCAESIVRWRDAKTDEEDAAAQQAMFDAVRGLS